MPDTGLMEHLASYSGFAQSLKGNPTAFTLMLQCDFAIDLNSTMARALKGPDGSPQPDKASNT